MVTAGTIKKRRAAKRRAIASCADADRIDASKPPSRSASNYEYHQYRQIDTATNLPRRLSSFLEYRILPDNCCVCFGESYICFELELVKIIGGVEQSIGPEDDVCLIGFPANTLISNVTVYISNENISPMCPLYPYESYIDLLTKQYNPEKLVSSALLFSAGSR